jgi:hypothetical protein
MPTEPERQPERPASVPALRVVTSAAQPRASPHPFGIPLGDGPPSRGARAAPAAAAGPVLLTLAAVLVWANGLRSVDLSRTSDLGLASVLPVLVLAAPAVVTVAFVWTLRQRPLRQPLLVVHVAALLVVLYGMTAVVETVPGLNVAWRHAGIVDYIASNGRVDPKLDAYFNWPGFFILSAFLTDVAGLKNVISITEWAPAFFNLLYLGPLLLLFKGATTDRRLVWLAVWFFYVSNWIKQDYFAPQALTYFLYLLILAILLRWFGRDRSRRPAPARFLPWRPPPPAGGTILGSRPVTAFNPTEGPRHRSGLMAMVVLLFAAAVPSHQLTPFAILVAVTALVALGRCSARGLPVLMAVMLVTWITFMTSPFLAGHLSVLSGQVGQVKTIAAANVADRLQGSTGHLLVVRIRVVTTVMLWALAALGLIRRRRRGYDDVSFTVLALAPFPLLLLQNYGGELLLRAYFFSLPFVAFLAATSFFPEPSVRVRWRTTVAVAAAGAVLLAGFVFARYGNERIDYFTPAEVQAVQYLYRTAPSGSLLLAVTPDLPWKFEGYASYKYRTVLGLKSSGSGNEDLLRRVLHEMGTNRWPGAYVIISRSQRAYVDAFGSLRPGELERLELGLRRSPAVQLVYQSQDATIFSLRDGRS